MRLAIAVLVGALLAGVAWQWHETPSVAGVVDELPVYPGARRIQGTDEALTYRLPRPTTRAAVHEFYAQRLDGWRDADDCPDIGFQRERTLLLVGPDAFDPRYIRILVKPGGDCETWSWVIYS